jgi:hypothetical protein
MANSRVKRPKLERNRPVRTWSTLFGTTAGERNAPVPASAEPARESAAKPRTEAQSLLDSVDTGYRVIDDYLNQGRKVAQAFGPQFRGFGESMGAGPEAPEMAQRVMQYGWDFVGMWFEMWSKVAGSNPGIPSPAAAGSVSEPGPKPESRAAEPPPAVSPTTPPADGAPARVVVTVSSRRPTTTSLDVRAGTSSLVVHALRPEGHDGPPIRTIEIRHDADDGTISVKVVVGEEHPPGIYNAIIVDATTNLPRGTLSLEILPTGDS